MKTKARDRSLISAILPPEVAAVETQSPLPNGFLLPEEAALVRDAVEKRRREFTLGRTCARGALEKLGFAGFPILTGGSRQPLWPDGIVGSITHCDGYAAAAVARRTEVAGLGIDGEHNIPLPAEVLNLIASEKEREMLSRLNSDDVCWDRLLYSAKESFFKTWFPMTGQWLDFLEAHVTVHPDRCTFSISLLGANPKPDCWEGRYGIGSGLILTAVALRP